MAVLRTAASAAALAGLLVAGRDLDAQAVRASEYQVKAVFLFNFAQFVEWPPAAFPDSQTPIVLGILGDDPFGEFLDETVRGETVNGRAFAVQRYHAIEDISTCHILFISQSERPRMEQTLARLKDRSTLTVGDGDGFTQRGGMIRFITEENRVRLRINVGATRAANLTISSKLLRAADVVGDGS